MIVSEDFQICDKIFSDVLGVDPEEEFFAELVVYSSELMKQLPSGWEIVLGEGDFEGIPMFLDANISETYWDHPFEEKFKLDIIHVHYAVPHATVECLDGAFEGNALGIVVLLQNLRFR